MTTIEISLELLGIMVLLGLVLIIVYFLCLRPCMLEYPRPKMVIVCPDCGTWLDSKPREAYYCRNCDKHFKRKAR